MAINFSCAPGSAARLVDLALDQVETLQEAGPTLEEVRSPCNLCSCSSQLRFHDHPLQQFLSHAACDGADNLVHNRLLGGEAE